MMQSAISLELDHERVRQLSSCARLGRISMHAASMVNEWLAVPPGPAPMMQYWLDSPTVLTVKMTNKIHNETTAIISLHH